MGFGRFLRTWRRFGLLAAMGRSGADEMDCERASDASPVVVGGCGRSGTTLLRVMLDSHGSLCCGPESELFLPEPVHLDVLCERFDIPPKALAGIYRRAASRCEFVDAFFAEYARRVGKPRWAEKSPRNVHRIEFVFRAFPEARFLHMIRDGRDVACSLRTHPRHNVVDGELVPTNICRPIAECAERWVVALRAAEPWRDDPRYMEVRYEDLLADPRATLEEVCRFIGEPWDERMLEYHEVDSGSRDVTKFPQNPEATEAIRTRSLQRWQRDFSEADKRVFKDVAGEMLIRTGYADSNDW